MGNRYSVPSKYIGKPVKILVRFDQLQIYYSTDLIAQYTISDKKLNYKPEHYKELMSHYITDTDLVSRYAEENLRQMDDFL